MEDLILLTKDEAWDILRVLERTVAAAESGGVEDGEAQLAFRTLAAKLYPDLFPDE